jgi:modulator of FtsH protease HflK
MPNNRYREEDDIETKVIKGVKRWAPIASLGLAAVLGFGLSYRPVASQNLGVVTQLGRYDRTVSAGPHFIIPLVEGMQQVDVTTYHSVEVGFRTIREGTTDRAAEYRDATNDNEMKAEAQMLTADENIAWVSMVLQYKVDPIKVTDYLYNVKEQEATVQRVSEAALRQVVGNYGVDEVLTFGRNEIAEKVKEETQKLMDEYKMGVEVTGVYLQSPRAPMEYGSTNKMTVFQAFQDVETQRQNKEAAINNAQAYKNKITTEAQGIASQTIAQAEGQKATRIGEAKQDVAEFNLLYQQYLLDPLGVKQRLYLETMEKIYPNLEKIIVDSSLVNKGMLPLFDLNGGN